MIKDFVITITITVVTLLVSLGIIRYQAPHLLGIPNDLQIVRVSEEMPPFFESVFPEKNPQSSGFTLSEFIIKDPYTGVRAQPLYSDVGGMGPNDILGFRNKSVPNVADIIVIGDSQTYGNNSRIDRNWPNRMTDALNKNQMTMAYNMSVGGRGGESSIYMLQLMRQYFSQKFW